MRRLPLLALLAAGCGGEGGKGLATHEACTDAHIAAMEDLAEVLDGIHDLATAEAARPRTEAIGERVREINAAEDRLPPAGPVEQAQLNQRLEQAAQGFGLRVEAAMARVKEDPKAVVLLSNLLIDAALDTDREAPPEADR